MYSPNKNVFTSYLVALFEVVSSNNINTTNKIIIDSN